MSIQRKIISLFQVRSFIDPSNEFRVGVDFLKSFLKRNQSLKTLVLGLSGGQDSSLVGKMCQQSIDEIRKNNKNREKYKFIAVRLPYGRQKDEKDCQDAINFIGPDQVITVDIKPAVQASILSLRKSGIVLNNHAKGNEKARERMKVQYSIASMMSGVVVGTRNAVESMIGFFTKYGDGGTDINPISHLNKRQGKSILRFLNCPRHLYMKPPTADLEEHYPLFPDEEKIGISYEIMDDYLEGKLIDSSISNLIERKYKKNRHKHFAPISMKNSFFDKKDQEWS